MSQKEAWLYPPTIQRSYVPANSPPFTLNDEIVLLLVLESKIKDVLTHSNPSEMQQIFQ